MRIVGGRGGWWEIEEDGERQRRIVGGRGGW